MDPVGTLGEEEIYTFGDEEGITMYENVLRAMKEKFDVEKELLERQNKNLREKVIQVEAKNEKLKAINLKLEKEKNALQPMWCGHYSPPFLEKKV